MSQENFTSLSMESGNGRPMFESYYALFVLTYKHFLTKNVFDNVLLQNNFILFVCNDNISMLSIKLFLDEREISKGRRDLEF